jgi:hypothetical protein
MQQRMDTAVQESEIAEYYELNKQDFKLTKDIVKAIFVKIPEEFADREQLITWSSNLTAENMIELRDYCVQYAKNYDIIDDYWVDFDVVKRNLPQQITDNKRFLTENKYFETTDSVYYYLVYIQEFKLINELAPVEYVYDNIKNLILNRRKIEFLKEVENNVFTEGIRQNKFKIFKSEIDENQ